MLTVFMAMGAWRISQARVLTRRAAAIETLGSATVLCTDKTGTLTENRMTIAELRLKVRGVFRPERGTRRRTSRGVSRTGRVRPSRQRAGSLRSHGEGVSRPRPRASWRGLSIYMARMEARARLTGFAPISSPCRRSGRPRAATGVRRRRQGRARSHRRSLPSQRRESVRLTQVRSTTMAAEGLRVLGVARADFAGSTWPDLQHDFTFEFFGLVGLADPLRAERARRGGRMPIRRHQSGHDHRRLPGDRQSDRPPGGPRCRRPRDRRRARAA